MGLEIIVKFGYFLMIITLILMIWASLAKASREFDSIKYPPCTFNPLCTCSKAAPDLGIVYCRNVPFPAIPRTVNSSKVFMLHMENTDLRILEPYFLQATGLYRLEISHNPIMDIPDDAFVGLERSLWELFLQKNRLIEVPSKAFRYLQKLKYLDLSGNQISYVEPDSWKGLENSLHYLILSENSLSALPPDGFSSLRVLDTLDLSKNNLKEIDGSVFRDGMDRLSKLLLADNLLSEIPYVQMSPLRMLKVLDLSFNRIDGMQIEGNEYAPNIKLSLDTLHLEYNGIDKLQTGSFQFFDILNKTYLDGNPIKTINEDAFRQAKIRELYMRHCHLDFISPAAFGGLENSLQVLDLSGNNISNLSDKLFNNFDYLRFLNLKDNDIKTISPTEMFNGFHHTLFILDLSGSENGPTSFQDLRRMRNLRSLSISRLLSDQLIPDDFLEFGVELEDLKITRSSLKSLKSHTFMHVKGLKRLDLSDNKISVIENEAFIEIGHSLISLKLSHGLSQSTTTLPSDILQHLTSLQELDISNNKIKSISDTSFHFLNKLRVLDLKDNEIDQVLKGTFQGDIHSNLEEICLSFNNLRHISQHTFVDLQSLRKLKIDDNRIERIERRAFMNLDQLRHLNLRGNKITSISDEAFQINEKDPFSKKICWTCVLNVNNFYTTACKYDKNQSKLHSTLKDDEKSQAYGAIIHNINEHYNQIKILVKGSSPRCSLDISQSLSTLENTSEQKENSILRQILLNKCSYYKVRSLHLLCIDYINREGYCWLDTYLKCERAVFQDDDSSADSESNTNIFIDDESINCELNSENNINSNDESAIFNQQNNELLTKRRNLDFKCEEPIMKKPLTRAKSRVNYSEDYFLDDLLLYEQYLLQDFPIEKTKETVSLLNSKNDSINCLPPKKQANFNTRPKRKNEDKKDSVVATLKDIKEQFKTNPSTVVQFNSSVSIQLKSSSNKLENDYLNIRPVIKETVCNLSNNHPITWCRICSKDCEDLKILAKHQMNHIILNIQKIDRIEILHPNYRRGKKIGDNFRCLNCWSIYSNHTSIKEHWIKGKCEYFCRICGQSFHKNPHLLHSHFPEVHGIRFLLSAFSNLHSKNQINLNYKINNKLSKVRNNEICEKTRLTISNHTHVKKKITIITSKKKSISKTKYGPDGRVTCQICFCSFPNIKSKNSHMRLHVKKHLKLSTAINTNIQHEEKVTEGSLSLNITNHLQQQQQQKKPKHSPFHKPVFQINKQLQLEIKRYMELQEIQLRAREQYESSQLPPILPLNRIVMRPSAPDRHLHLNPIPSREQLHYRMQHPSLYIPPEQHLSHHPVTSQNLVLSQSRQPPLTYNNSMFTSSSSSAVNNQIDISKLYTCIPCGIKVTTKSELYQHKKVCREIKQYTCPFCLNNFSNSKDLQVHINLNHPESDIQKN